MGLQIRELSRKDYNKAIQSAIKGMHFDWYLDQPFLLNLYGRYFWYLEMIRATQIIAAYADDEFAGVLLADMKGEKKIYRSFWNQLYVKAFHFLQKLYSEDGVGVYDKANKEMFMKYCENNSPDGEIIFLAANADMKVKGVGSFLLKEFEYREKGKHVFLFTDHACTYQFYEHRGFYRAGEKDIELEIRNKKVALKCLLYSKEIKCEVTDAISD